MLVKHIGPDGLERQRDLDITTEEWDLYHNKGVSPTNAFPNLSEEDLLFVQTGLTQEEYDEVLRIKSPD